MLAGWSGTKSGISLKVSSVEPPSASLQHFVASNPVSAKYTTNVEQNGFRFLVRTLIFAVSILTRLDAHPGDNVYSESSGTTVGSTSIPMNYGYDIVPWAAYSKPQAVAAEALQTPLDPQAPEGLTSWPVSESQINLSWTDRADSETAFVVKRRTGWGGTWLVVTDALPPDEEVFADTGLEADTEYFYRVSARIGGADLASEIARAVTDDRPFGNRTLAFQNGVNRYDRTKDVGIIQTSPSESALDPYVWIVVNGFRDEFQALLRFDQIIGENPDQVPPGARITGAFLRIYLGAIPGADCDDPILFHRMLVPWDETSTWDSEPWGENGIIRNTHAERIPNFNTTFPLTGKYYEVEVNISSLQARVD
jgi:hypothetical protein